MELLLAERMRRGCGLGAQAVSCWTHAVLILRWFRDDTRVATLARDAGVLIATAYRYLHEGIDVLAARAPDLHDVLRRGKDAGWSNVTVDGTLIETDRCRTKNPESGHDLWFSGKHRHHGGNIQVVGDPDGLPVYASPVQPGSTHDITGHRFETVDVGAPERSAFQRITPVQGAVGGPRQLERRTPGYWGAKDSPKAEPQAAT